ncbi:MAG: threonine ammonia-lyase IlvA [Flavobacteriaceae bacterium]|nr:threonine ammonia-lyase IlvA [Flavobacteriaceae bacterium]
MKESLKVSLDKVREAKENLVGVANKTPLQRVDNLSKEYKSNIYFKREDLQVVRSYKIRGAYNKINSLSKEELKRGVVCASAGNHSQGFALSCSKLKVKGNIFMPVTTPMQKVNQAAVFGGEYVEIKLIGDTFDQACKAADKFCKENNLSFVHPFDDEKIIEGQATVGLEILEDKNESIDYLFLPVGGGGLASGVSSVFKQLSPNTKIIAFEPKGAPSLQKALEVGKPIELDKIDSFVDGAAVKKIGNITFGYCKELLDEVKLVDEGAVCSTILKLYNENAMVIEPAGALSVSGLEQYKEQIKGKNVVCIISGGNNDITRMEEMKERALLHRGLKHYFLVDFPQRAGALKEFLIEVLGENDDISHFEYTKKNHRTKGSAVVGVELKDKGDFIPLVERMKEKGYLGEYLNDNEKLFQFII